MIIISLKVFQKNWKHTFKEHLFTYIFSIWTHSQPLARLTSLLLHNSRECEIYCRGGSFMLMFIKFLSYGSIFILCGIAGVWKSSRKKKKSFLQDYFSRFVWKTIDAFRVFVFFRQVIIQEIGGISRISIYEDLEKVGDSRRFKSRSGGSYKIGEEITVWNKRGSR